MIGIEFTTQGIEIENGVESPAQDRQGPLRANGRDPNVEQAPHSHGRWPVTPWTDQDFAALIIGEREVDMFVNALDDVLTIAAIPRPDVGAGNNFVKAALGSKRPVTPSRPVSA